MRPRGSRRLFRFPSRTAGEVRSDISEEFAFHVDMRTEELVGEGMRPAAARAQALRELGGTERAASDLATVGDRVERRRRAFRVLADLGHDARLGLRLLWRSPGFAAVAILTLALGIGANTAIYSVLDAVLFRPLPYPEPDRIVMVSETLENGRRNSVSGGAFLDWRMHQTQFAAMTLTGRVSFNLQGAGVPERLKGLEVSHEFLDVLGIPPLLGRGFMPEDDRPGGSNDVVIITEELWRSRFAADSSIVGSAIVLDEIPRTIVGVLPKGAWLFKEDVFFVPAVLAPGNPRATRSGHWAGVFARLASNSTVARADAELKEIKRRLNSEYPGFKQNWSVMVQPVTDVIGDLARTPLLLLFGAVSLVLLIACTNISNLLLARGCHRQRELAVRAALGAGGGRLVRQLLAENLVLAVLGGLAGILVAYAGVDILRRLTAGAMPIAVTPRLDSQVLLVSAAVTIVAGSLVGLLPALRARRPDLAEMNAGSKGTSSGGRQRTQSLLIVAEVALTVILLASAGLLLRSLAKAASEDPGFDPAHALAFDLSLPDVSYSTSEKRLAFATELLTRLRALPGVEGAGTGMAIPFTGGGFGEFFRRPDGRESEPVIGRMDFVSPGYLEALGTRLLLGRRLTDADNRPNGPRVAVISERTMRLFFPKGDAVGQPLIIRAQTWQVIGVIADVVDRRLDTPPGAFGYVPSAFNPGSSSVVMRTRLDPSSLAAAAAAEVARLDPGVALANPRSLEQAMADSLTERRVVLALVGVFAIAALVLAALGLYGVMAFTVATRRREFGIRLALGAVRSNLVRHVIGSALRLTGSGVLTGLLGAAVLSRLLENQLYEVRGTDPIVIAGTTALVLAVAMLACWIPAWRAAGAEPTVALRAE